MSCPLTLTVRDFLLLRTYGLRTTTPRIYRRKISEIKEEILEINRKLGRLTVEPAD
jgi:hypothetical protein